MKKILTTIFVLLTFQVSAAGAPPLVLEPNKYSYTFGVPAEWEFSFEQAHHLELN